MNRLDVCLKSLEKLKSLKEGWDGEDGEIINEKSYLKTKDLLFYIFSNIPLTIISSIDLCSDGSVDLNWRNTDGLALLININEDNISYYGHLEKDMIITNIIKSNELKSDLLKWIAVNLLEIDFPIGSKMYWIKTNLPAYEKIAEDEWVSLDSIYLEERKEGKEIFYDLKPESEKPLYRNGKLNRFSFKWPDEMVYNYYKNFMKFEL